MTAIQKNIDNGRHVRGAGILLPVASLMGADGRGGMGAQAYKFVDFLREAGQRYWQLLPLCPTDKANSPYQSPAAFAGSYALIDMERLCEEGLLEKGEYASYCGKPLELLRRAYGRFRGCEDYSSFCGDNAYWLDDYALYMALKERFHGAAWQTWEPGARERQKNAMNEYRAELSEDIDFWRFVQFIFFRQWQALRAYANASDIEIIGDIPLYVSGDSADCWAHREHFMLDASGYPACVGGVPPDGFSEDGQNWNMPVYNWPRHAQDGFLWWSKRMERAAELYDLIRIDHFIGLSRYFQISGMDAPASEGQWHTGPGEALLNAITAAIPAERLIAEDLGHRNPETDRLMQAFNIPGMRVLQFAFDGKPENINLPHNYNKHTIVYGGTHDNEPLAAFFESHPEECARAARYMGLSEDGDMVGNAIRLGMASTADRAIFQIQDYLGLGAEARINTPGTVGAHNWAWRLDIKLLTPGLAKRIRELSSLYGR